MIQVVNPNNHLFPAGAKTLAGKIQAVISLVLIPVGDWVYPGP
jgi:hypothetical protein